MIGLFVGQTREEEEEEAHGHREKQPTNLLGNPLLQNGFRNWRVDRIDIQSTDTQAQGEATNQFARQSTSTKWV